MKGIHTLVGKHAPRRRESSQILNGEVHDRFSKEAEQKGWKTERKETRRTDRETGRDVYPDAIDECGRPVELKPDTPSGRRRAKKQAEKYKRATGKDPVIIYYDPKTGKILYP